MLDTLKQCALVKGLTQLDILAGSKILIPKLIPKNVILEGKFSALVKIHFLIVLEQIQKNSFGIGVRIG